MERKSEQGYALIAVVVMVFLVMLALGVAAPRVAKQLRRENEVEAKNRGDQYTRAIRVFYRKNGAHYPSSIEQLEKTNNVRYLRQRYVDPITGKDDWRLIHLGENKTTVKGFFGQPLAGLATSNIGSSQGLYSPGTPIGASSSAVGGTAGASSSPSGVGQSSGSGFGSSSTTFGGSSAFGSSASPGLGASSNTTAGAGGAGGSNAAGTGATGSSSMSGSQPLGSGGPIIGVGTGATGDSILDLNEQTSYETWEFVYDPRIEQLYAKANLMGGAGSSSGGLGNGGSSIAPNNPNGPSQSSPFGSSPNSPGSNSPFGSSPTSPGSSSPFGSSPSSPGSSPFGSSPTR